VSAGAPAGTPGAVIEAAGGVVLRTGATGPEVLVVHRLRQDDWSLPKGHLDPGEDATAAAVREVHEETGVACTITRALGTTAYVGPRGPKRVTWFVMRPVDGDPAARPADDEVDMARWTPVAHLEDLLTYPTDLDLVRTALDAGPPR
jgi:8-oxo-dGTP pyrophosphatase MutT (NUDIX family)